MQTAQEWIQQLELIAHPEGGYYRETLRDSDVNRAPYSSIYFLLTHERSHIFTELMPMKFGIIMLERL